MTREFSAGGAAFKKTPAGIVWLIIKPLPSVDFPADRYQLPKGHINPGEKPTETAVREVQEETGIDAKILAKLDTQKYTFPFRGNKIFKIVTFYLMEYLSGEPTENAEAEKVMWLPFKEAKKTLTYFHDKSVLTKASETLLTLGTH